MNTAHKNFNLKMWTREATSILIEEYQANECMWMTTSPFYRNKQKRTESLVQIALKVSKCRSQTSVEDIKNKINGIRTQYVSEINKLIIAGNRGDAYEPTLWCFDLLSFLKPFTQPKQRALNGSWPRTILIWSNCLNKIMCAHTGKRKALTFEEKLNIIQKVKENPTIKRISVAKEFGIPASTLSTILAKRDVLVADASCVTNMCKRKRVGKYEDIEQRLLMWYNYMQHLNVPVNGTTLRTMAQQIAAEMNIEFTGSNGWIHRFKKRTGIKYDRTRAPKHIFRNGEKATDNEDEPKPYKPSFASNSKPSIHTYTSSSSAVRQPSINASSDKNCIIIKEENEDDDIELIEEEDTLQTDEDYSNISAYHPEQTLEEFHEEQYQLPATSSAKQSSPSTSNLDSGFDESHEQDRFRRLFSPENNPEVTLVPKRELMKRKTEESTDNDDYVEEKKKKNDEYKVEKREEDTDDRISIFGKFVMSRMRTVTDKVLLMKLEHTIQNAIIDAQLKQTELDEKNNKEDNV